jgi:type I restriction enzyme M protein
MAIKKSELYARLWESSDALRGGMDASQYKDYVLVMLFIKYISDKYAGQPFASITVPEGSGFNDMCQLKGRSDIGDKINSQIIMPIAQANDLPEADFPDFNDSNKLGSGKEMVDRLTNLIAIFEHKDLDFSTNRSDGDDLLGDAYEYLMRHFATESGKSKGQFYTPSEVSRIMAKIIGIRNHASNATTTVYDPTCGSGALLLKVADESGTQVTIYGQEKDVATAGLARMNMVLHDFPTASIIGGASTLANPKFTENGNLKTFDFVVANPPFSDKRWSTGFNPSEDEHNRFESFGIPPDKQGDFAYLLHIVRSLKSTGKGACILPHGVLFRGNAEGDIRKNLIRKGYIKGIIGLPANLFYGTGIPACIIIIDKEHAHARKGIFMIDASSGFMKDGPKNRLRDQDIHKIVDAFNNSAEIPKYSRMVPMEEIERNEFNLNLPRYIDSSEPEDIQDLEGHLKGGIPGADIEALDAYWKVCPGLRASLFVDLRPGYFELATEKSGIKDTIFTHSEFKAFKEQVMNMYQVWRDQWTPQLKDLGKGIHPKEEIKKISESMLAHFGGAPLADPYAIYQHLMELWESTLSDDLYILKENGWVAEPQKIYETKNGVKKEKGWDCDFIPKSLLIAERLKEDQQHLDSLQAEIDRLEAELEQIEEENSGEEGAFSSLEKVSLAEVKKLIKESGAVMSDEEKSVCKQYVQSSEKLSTLKKDLKGAAASLDDSAWKEYSKLTESEVKTLVVENKWLASIQQGVEAEVDRVSQALTQRVKTLAERYESPLPDLELTVEILDAKVKAHLEKMGFSW